MYKNIQRHADRLLVEQLFRDTQNLTKLSAEHSDALILVNIVAESVHDSKFDEFTEFPDNWLPERIHLYDLDRVFRDGLKTIGNAIVVDAIEAGH